MSQDTPKSAGRPKTLQFELDNARDGGASRERIEVVATVLEGPAMGTLLVTSDEPKVVGRDPSSDLVLDDPGISGRHLRLFRIQSRTFVEDLRSTNGTYLNGRRLTDVQALDDGDRIEIGRGTALGIRTHTASELAAIRRLYETSVIDALTGLHNRRHFDERLVTEVAFANRHGTALSLLLLDVDHFKRINDTYGHPMGDQVLKAIGRALRAHVRTEDLACRFGGEEFAVLARGIAAKAAHAFGERIRAILAQTTIPTASGPLAMTVSVGAASCERGGVTPAALVATADAALYEAKREGRNRVRTALVHGE